MGILQAIILGWVAIPFSRKLPDPGIELGFPHDRQILYHLSHQGNPTEQQRQWHLMPHLFNSGGAHRFSPLTVASSGGTWGPATQGKADPGSPSSHFSPLWQQKLKLKRSLMLRSAPHLSAPGEVPASPKAQAVLIRALDQTSYRGGGGW